MALVALNADQFPIGVERWRMKHKAVESAAWINTLRHLADDRAGVVGIDRKRALRRRYFVKALGLQ